MLQIRYGCRNEKCTTPTCFSCQKRASGAPIRRPTVLTALTMAYHLASQDHPMAALCPHKARNEVADLAQQTKDRRSLTQNLFDTTAAKSLPVQKSSTLEVRPGHTRDIALATSHLSCEIMGALRTLLGEHKESWEQQPCASPISSTSPRAEALSYVNRSLYHGLSNADVLLQSFREGSWSAAKDSPLSHLDPSTLEHAFRA